MAESEAAVISPRLHASRAPQVTETALSARQLCESLRHARAMPPETLPDPAEVEAKTRDLLADASLQQPDELIHDLEHAELHFRWNTEKLVVIVELTEQPKPWAATTPPV